MDFLVNLLERGQLHELVDGLLDDRARVRVERVGGEHVPLVGHVRHQLDRILLGVDVHVIVHVVDKLGKLTGERQALRLGDALRPRDEKRLVLPR